MSKSLNNAINLKARAEEISAAVQKMFTDPDHLRVSDAGKIKGNVVFTYLDAFDCDKNEVARLKQHYQQGGLGDSVIKKRLDNILQGMMEPIRKEREKYAADRREMLRILKEGTLRGKEVAHQTLSAVKTAMGIHQLL